MRNKSEEDENIFVKGRRSADNIYVKEGVVANQSPAFTPLKRDQESDVTKSQEIKQKDYDQFLSPGALELKYSILLFTFLFMLCLIGIRLIISFESVKMKENGKRN